MRHVAASIVVLTDGKEMRQACVDVQGEVVTAIRPLTNETPFKGWPGGTNQVRQENGNLMAYPEIGHTAGRAIS